MSRRLQVSWAISLAVFLFLGLLIGRSLAVKRDVQPSQDAVNYEMVMAALDAGWRVTWQGVQPAPDRSDDTISCWRVPLYDVTMGDAPLMSWRCQDQAGEVTYNWLAEKTE
jgi:hypothetical protein